MQTVGKWRRRFVERDLDGLLDEPRPGVPRKIGDAKVDSVIVQTLESQPSGATHWSTRSMARHSGISTSSVGRIWRAFGLQPRRVETFKLSTDPLFVDKVRDIVGLYINPPDLALVLCVDEKTQIQALDRSQPLLPMRPGQVEWRPLRANHELHRDRRTRGQRSGCKAAHQSFAGCRAYAAMALEEAAGPRDRELRCCPQRDRQIDPVWLASYDKEGR